MKQNLPPIPVAPRVFWRECRRKVLPVVVFLVLVCLASALWTRFSSPQRFAGVGEGLRARVASPQTGWLRELKVGPCQKVRKGDPIAVVELVDPRVPLDLLQTEMQLARLQREPLPADRNAMSYERVRVELLRLKAELATVRVNLARAENEVKRDAGLFREKIVSQDVYDLSLKTRDAYAAEVTAKDAAVLEIEQRLTVLKGLGEPASAVNDSQVQGLLSRLDRTRASSTNNGGLVTLTAPISGTVCGIHRQPGECVLPGESLVSLASPNSQRIIAYLRQPYSFDPEPGMEALVTTRTERPIQFRAPIAQVGPQVETITNSLAIVRQGTLMDVGLPLIIELPAQNQVRPGETVDIWIEPPASAK